MSFEHRKRIYNTLDGFFHDLFLLGANGFAYIRNARNATVSDALREKLMVAVSGVLACKYCTWLHSEMALTHGVKSAEIQKLLSQEMGYFPEDEAVALAFAQHYSESGGCPREEAEKRLYDYYGKKKAQYILSYLQIIYFGNLAGNTVDAFLDRLKGSPAEGSDPGNEIIIFLLLAPYYLAMLPVLAYLLGRLNSRQ
ncbi:MAG: carboxymuconolactone decarboxylase family protein [Deltaproteobacteria bacterium]|nr:carboxymuconolactone decarboxylase family protein [Deltaproteobacteria bacterium]